MLLSTDAVMHVL